MKVKFDWSIQDSKLSPDTGRLVIYGDHSFHSNGPSMDHNDCIAALASKSRISKSELMSKAYRFYWRRIDGDTIQASPVRKLDEDWVYKYKELFQRTIDGEFGS